MTHKVSLSDIKIRKELLPGDLGYIAYIHGVQYAKELGYGLNFEAYVLAGLQELAGQYDFKKDRVWMCEHEGEIIGFLVGLHREESVQLRYFMFLPEYRGIGLGKRLMSEFISYMEETGYHKAYLWTTSQQQAAIAFYEKSGFVLTEERISNAFDIQLNERRYELVLTPFKAAE